MNIDPNYKVIAIKPDDTELARYAKILSRVVTFVSCSDTIMSGKTIIQIIGDDEYSTLTLDAVGYQLDHTVEELETYIKFRLAEMAKPTDEVARDKGELHDLRTEIAEYLDQYREGLDTVQAMQAASDILHLCKQAGLRKFAPALKE